LSGLRQLVVLHTVKQPAVLIEAGLIVNRESEQILAMPHTRESIAHPIAEGIANCLTGRTEAQ
jgi:N-acetylmuramoyl-L-alanine amidase